MEHSDTSDFSTAAASGTSILRSQNRTAVLRQVQKGGLLSRVDLAGRLGISKSTVSLVVSDLIAEGLVTELSVAPTGVGRPALALELSGQTAYFCAWEADVESVSVGIYNFSGECVAVERQAKAAGASPHDTVELLCAITSKHYAAFAGKRWVALAMSVPGLIDPKSGVLTLAPNLGWSNVQLLPLVAERLEAHGLRFEMPVQIDNEANLAAFGSYFFDHPNVHNLVYLSMGVGVGAGLIVDSKPYTGALGHAGEVGHISLDLKGRACSCGKRGCVETFLNLEQLRKAKNSNQDLRDMATRLAQLIGMIAATYDPNVFIVGGPLMKEVDDTFFEMVEQQLPNFLLAALLPTVKILHSSVRSDEVLRGAGIKAINSFIEYGQKPKKV